jgi:hypothetical protein
MTLRGLALMAEIVSVLARHQGLRVAPAVETDDNEEGLVTISLTLHPSTTGEMLAALALHDELRCLLDIVQVRELASRYDLDPRELEPLLRRIHGEPRRTLTAGAPEPAAEATPERRTTRER